MLQQLCLRCGRISWLTLLAWPIRTAITASPTLISGGYFRSISSVPPQDSRSDVPSDKGDIPVQYSSSNAFRHKVLDFDKEDAKPKYQKPIVLTSLFLFMMYFFVLREENDLDREMKKPLWERVPGLERQTLQALIEYNRKNNLDNTVAEARLAEVLAEEAAGVGAAFHHTSVETASPAMKTLPATVVVAGKAIAK